jgi:hypothetical protein
MNQNDQIARTCVCCTGEQIEKSPAVLMPFVSSRAMGLFPIKIDSSWGIRDLQEGMAYFLCHSAFCSKCHHLFMDYRFSEHEMNSLYAGYMNEDYVRERIKFEPLFRPRREEFPELLESRESFIKSHMAVPSTILDWGGDSGERTPFLKTANKVFIVDISNNSVKAPAISITREGALKASPDLIVCSHVLEHIPYPRDFLSEVSDYISGESALFIEVPMEKIMRGDFRKFPPQVSKKTWHEHINFFSKDSLNKLLEELGYVVCDLREFEYRPDCFVLQALAKKKSSL